MPIETFPVIENMFDNLIYGADKGISEVLQ